MAFSRRDTIQLLVSGAVSTIIFGLFKVSGAKEIPRPPGALEEKSFLEYCARCYRCVDVCPTDAIRPAGIAGGIDVLAAYVAGYELWAQVAALADRALSSGDYPNDPSERFVFIEGYAHAGEWARALEYSIQSHRVSPNFVDPMLCKLWKRIEIQTEDGPEKTAALAEIKTKLACIP